MALFDKVIKRALERVRLIAKQSKELAKQQAQADREEEVDDPLDVDIPPKPSMGTAGPIDDTTLVNELPSCITCGSTMMLQGKGVQMTRVGTPTECIITFCPKCAQTAFVMFRAKIFREEPDKKPELAIDAYWSHPEHRRETNNRLAKLKESLDQYDTVKQMQAEEKENPSLN